MFQRAREKSEEGWPVIVFFDEMDSMFRTRGSGISSDMESTIVPQLLAEIDGGEGLRNVIVIGATNREDLIDPAILRPGRLDVKIKIERRMRTRRASDLRSLFDRRDPIAPGREGPDMIVRRSKRCTRRRDHQFLEARTRRRQGDLYTRTLVGAMIETSFARQKLAIKRVIAGGARGVSTQDLLDSIKQEYKEHEDLPNTTNPTTGRRSAARRANACVLNTLSRVVQSRSRRGRAIERGRYWPIPLASTWRQWSHHRHPSVGRATMTDHGDRMVAAGHDDAVRAFIPNGL